MAVDSKLNGKPVTVDVPDGTRLLWVLRENVKLIGTKYFLRERVVAALHA